MNQMPKEDLSALSDDFRQSMQNNLLVFGEHSFRKHQPGQERRGVLNASLWDVLSTGLSSYPEAIVAARKDSLLREFYGLMDDNLFIRSITYGPNTAKEVRHRFSVMQRTLAEVFHA
jgi:hypothetical protein